MTRSRIVVLGFLVALFGCGDEKPSSMYQPTGSQQTMAPPDGGRFGLYSSRYVYQSSLMDARALLLEMNCVRTADRMVAQALQQAPPGRYDMSDNARQRRQCVTIALCDFTNQCPDFYSFVEGSMRAGGDSEGLAWLRPNKRACTEVEEFGPDLIMAESALFEPVLAMRDKGLLSYKKPAGSTGGFDGTCRVTVE